MFNAIVISIIKTDFMKCRFVFDRERITLQPRFLFVERMVRNSLVTGFSI